MISDLSSGFKIVKNGGMKKTSYVYFEAMWNLVTFEAVLWKRPVSWHINNLIHFSNVILYVNSQKIVQTCRMAEITSNF